MRNKIRLDTITDVRDFVCAVENLPGDIVITDGSKHKINAKSILGAVYARADFSELWIESENDIYRHIEKFVINE